MSRDGSKGAVLYDVEASWCENATFVSDYRIPTAAMPDMSGLTHEKRDPGVVTQYANECADYVLMQKGGSFTTRHLITGHGASSAGAMSLSQLATLMGFIVGFAETGATAGTTTAAGWDENNGNFAASDTFDDGAIAWFGAKRDGRADGQPSVIGTHAGAAATLIVDLPAAPANLDVVYASDMIYRPESPDHAAQDFTGLRFELYTANRQVICRGCFAQSWTLTVVQNELPVFDVTWGVSWWDDLAKTFPVTDSPATQQAAPTAAGSLFFAAVGTSTRANNTIDYKSVEVSWQLGVQPEVGPGAVFEEQMFVGAKRLTDTITVTVVENAVNASTSMARVTQAETEGAVFHMLLSGNCRDGKRWALYLSRCKFIGTPEQFVENGINRLRWTVRASTGATGTTEMTRSAARIGLG